MARRKSKLCPYGPHSHRLLRAFLRCEKAARQKKEKWLQSPK